MELFILTVLKIVAVALAVLFAHGGVEMVNLGKLKNHWGGWAMTLTGSFVGFGLICKFCELQPSQWLPQLAAVMFIQSLAYLWWRATMPKAVRERHY